MKQRKQFTPLIIILLCALSISLSSCATRKPSEKEDSSSFTSSSEQRTSPSADDTSSSSAESSKEESLAPSEADLSEKEQAEVLEIVKNLLSRASTCDKIYRGALHKDENMPLTSFGGDEEYLLVLDSELISNEAITAYWNETFSSGEISTKHYETISTRKTYFPANGELFSIMPPFEDPLTMGEWDIYTLKFTEYTETTMRVTMSSFLAGVSIGESTLELVKNDGQWLLTDSYFLD